MPARLGKESSSAKGKEDAASSMLSTRTEGKWSQECEMACKDCHLRLFRWVKANRSMTDYLYLAVGFVICPSHAAGFVSS